MSELLALQATDYAALTDLTGFRPERIAAERADRHLAIVDDGQRTLARCSLWWRDTARVDGRRIGTIGHYAAADEACGRELLEQACRELRARGCELAVGPLDGSTWRQYRFITRRGTARPFFLEPDHPDGWPAHFTGAGFRTLARYVSDLNPDIVDRRPPLGSLPARMRRLGVAIDALNVESVEADLAGIYDVVRVSFRDAALYTPLEHEDFVSLYAPLVRTIDARLTLVARHEGRVVGFVFGPPDYLQPEAARDTLIVKTVAVLPERRYSGLGHVLVAALLRSAARLGYRRAISALMHASNRSRKMSRSCAVPMREYAVFARSLSS